MQGKMASDRGSHVHAITPDLELEVEAYLARAANALDVKDRLDFLSRALALDPGHPIAVKQMGEALRGSLVEDPSLAYVAEDDRLYLVRTTDDHDLAVPKRRSVPTLDRAESSILRLSKRWLGWALIGLIPAGLGALFCAPVAGALAILSIREARAESERRRAIAVGIGATLLFAAALMLLILLLLHV